MKGIIFDLDGTLLDTLEDIRAAINYARLAFEGEPIPGKDIKHYVGNGLRKALSLSVIEHGPKLESDEELDLMYQILMQYYINHPVVYTKPYKGIPELLDSLKEKGYKLAILSNKSNAIVQSIVKSCFRDNLFDSVQGQLSGVPLKPNPLALDNIIKALGLKKEDVLYIGDSEVDYITATNAHVKYFIVNYGFRSKEELSKSGIDSISHVPTLSEIEALL